VDSGDATSNKRRKNLEARENLTATLVTQAEDLAALEPAWRDLAGRVARPQPFLTYEWASTWWRHFGDRGGRRLRVVVVRDRDGRVVGIAPLFRVGWPVPRLAVIGTGHSDYLEVLVDGGEESRSDAIIAKMAETLAKLPARDWVVLALDQVPAGSPTAEFLSDVASRAGWLVKTIPGEICPYLPLPRSWDELAETIGKKMRKNLDYYWRRIEREHRLAIVAPGRDDVAAIGPLLDRFFLLHERRWHQRWMPGSFFLPRVLAFHRDVAKAMAEGDKLRLVGLAIDGEVVAVQYLFAAGDALFYYSGGFDPSWGWAGPGTLLLGQVIKGAIAEGRRVFDFLRGREEYKARWTQRERQNSRFIVARPGLAGSIALRWLARETEIIVKLKKRFVQ